MEVNWYNFDYHHKKMGYAIPARRYLEINLTGDSAADEIRIQFGELRVKEIVASEDTVNGVNFHFGDKCKYKQLVRVLDLCNTWCSWYAPSDSGIKVFQYRLKKYTNPNIETMDLQ